MLRMYPSAGLSTATMSMTLGGDGFAGAVSEVAATVNQERFRYAQFRGCRF